MDRGIESGSGIISSLQGVGYGSSRSLFPWNVAPSTQLMLYCMEPVKPASLGGENEYTYQSICKDLELTLSIEVLLFEDTYKDRSTLKRNNPILKLAPQINDSVLRSAGDIVDCFESVVQLVNRKNVFSSDTELFQISLQSKV